MNLKIRLIVAVLCLLSACKLFEPRIIVVNEWDKIPTTKNQNVCKLLKDTVVVYAVFVDVGIYHPWTEFDVESTMDSLEKASEWIHEKAMGFNQHVIVENKQHLDNGKYTIAERQARTSLSLNGIKGSSIRSRKKLLPWADAISRKVGSGVKYKSSSKMKTSIKIINTKNLNLALRDKFRRENVAILFFVNGYYENHPSYSFNCELVNDVEYSIITSKNPAVIAHEVLHLFGAVDLYPTYNFPNFNYPEIQELYPNEIMNVQHKVMEKLSISPITSYFIGWQDTLDKANMRLLLHKRNLLEY